jgi:hypothetical protein
MHRRTDGPKHATFNHRLWCTYTMYMETAVLTIVRIGLVRYTGGNHTAVRREDYGLSRALSGRTIFAYV